MCSAWGKFEAIKLKKKKNNNIEIPEGKSPETKNKIGFKKVW